MIPRSKLPISLRRIADRKHQTNERKEREHSCEKSSLPHPFVRRWDEPTKVHSAPPVPMNWRPSPSRARWSACRNSMLKEIEDVIMGCAMPEAEQGMNVARIASLRAGLPVEVSALTINRFCSSGLQAIAMAAERIMSGGAEVIVAGGTESMTMIPMGGHKVSPNPWLVDHYPGRVSHPWVSPPSAWRQRFGITREMADEFSLRSHQKALAAIQAGKFDEELVPVAGELHALRMDRSPSGRRSFSKWTKAPAPILRSKPCWR